MDVLFFLLFLGSLVALVVGLVKPSLVIRWRLDPTRKNVAIVFGTSAFILFILFAISIEKPSPESLSEKLVDQQAAQNTIFDIPALFGKTLSQLETIIGKPMRSGQPSEYSDGIGWAEWDKNGLTLSVNYDEDGNLINTGTIIGCAIAVFPQSGQWEESKLKQATNLSGSGYPFVIKSAENLDGKGYGLEICNQ